jgi:precorrin-6B methylase 2
VLQSTFRASSSSSYRNALVHSADDPRRMFQQGPRNADITERSIPDQGFNIQVQTTAARQLGQPAISEEDECTLDRGIDRPQLVQYDLFDPLSVKASRIGSDQGNAMDWKLCSMAIFRTMRGEAMLMFSNAVAIVLGALIAVGVFTLGWRWASRKWSLPCPSLLAWSLDNSLVQRSPLTLRTLDQIGFHPGEKVLEIGPGPGRLLIPAAQRVTPGGEVVGIDIQPKMVERLRRNAEKAGVTNVTVILADAAQPHVPEATFDLVFLCTALGEIPDRSAALTQCYRALKPGGRLSVTEVILDPHYQRRSIVERLAQRAGFRLVSIQGGWWFYTANFVKA